MSVSKYENYSVLMSVYYKENSEYLKQAIESIQAQTFPTDDFVLVCDGPLNQELDSVIKKKQQEMKNILNVVRLKKNAGLGNALNKGIQQCKNELVARMDSDDISYPDRCEKQLMVFNTYPEISVCSGIVEEFATNPKVVESRRVPPETQEEIREFLVHYSSVEQCRKEWKRRRERVNRENMFFVMNDRNYCTEEEIKAFDELPYV